MSGTRRGCDRTGGATAKPLRGTSSLRGFWALVPAFIIEELDDGRFTVFVPSVPTPLAGAVYILSRERVHPIDIPFTDAVTSLSRWGSGAKEMVAAMQATPRPAAST